MDGIKNMIGMPVDDEPKQTLAQRSVKARKKMGNPVNRRLTFSEVFGGDRDSLGKFAFGKMAEEGRPRVRTMSGKPHRPRKMKKDYDISPEEMANRLKVESESFGAEIFDDIGYEAENWE